MTGSDPPLTRAQPARRGPMIASLLAGTAVLVAAGILAINALTPASARISDSTSNESSVFSTGRIDLVVGTPSRLLFDADGLYPGLVLERCVPVTVEGSVDDLQLRLVAENAQTGGLAPYVRSTIEVGAGDDETCLDFDRDATRWSGTLAELGGHGPDSPLVLASPLDPPATVTVRFTAEVVDDDAAQGLDADFWVTLEAAQ